MKKLSPFNIELLFPTNQVVRQLRPTTKTDIYDGVTNNFDDDGLFSTITFGRVGTEERDQRFSYIQLNADIIHPAIFNVLKRLKSLYVDIILGRAYAVWDPELKDFKPADMITGETGMAFFCRHIHHLQPDKRVSKKRNMYVDVFEKYKKECLMNNHLVIPAGLRDLEVDTEGRETQDEINDLYRRLIFGANSINLVGGKTNDNSVDTPRSNLQTVANEIYANLKTRLDGKTGLIAGKWGGRKLVNGTRNVISSIDTTADVLHSPRAPSIDDVQVGLYQAIKGVSPITIHRLKERFLNEIFTDPTHPVKLIDPTTLSLVDVHLDPWVWDKWGTSEGLDKLLNAFSIDEERNNPVTIGQDKHYLYLVYLKGDKFKLFRDIQTLPEGYDRQDVHPITYSELYYLCNYENWYKLNALVTRYPITNINSIYPAHLYVRTTVDAKGKYELGDDWLTPVGYAKEYPTLNKDTTWLNTTVVSYTKLSALGADFDGDFDGYQHHHCTVKIM